MPLTRTTPVETGSTSTIVRLEKVTHFVDHVGGVVVDATNPGHGLYPSVAIRILDQNKAQWVDTRIGFGNGALARAGELSADAIWRREV